MIKVTKYYIILIIFFYKITYTQTVYESIIYLNTDGKSYTKYENFKSTYNSIYIYIPKGEDPLNYYQYINPNEFDVENIINKNYDKIVFNEGNYATIVNNIFSNKNLIETEGGFLYKTPRNNINNHYGLFWEGHKNSNFTKIAYVWIIPTEYQFTFYKCNRKGDWVKRDNSISFFGENINDILFEIGYSKIKKIPKKFKGRDVNIVKKIRLKKQNVILKVKDDNKKDGDIVSISLNGEWIIRRLKINSEKVEIALNFKKGLNYIIMYADNEGEIPPNTALISIGGEKITLHSSKKNGEALEVFVE